MSGKSQSASWQSGGRNETACHYMCCEGCCMCQQKEVFILKASVKKKKLAFCMLKWNCFKWNSCREQTLFTGDQKITVVIMEGIQTCFVRIWWHSPSIAEQIAEAFSFPPLPQRIKETAGAPQPLCFSLLGHQKINSTKAAVESVQQEIQTPAPLSSKLANKVHVAC